MSKNLFLTGTGTDIGKTYIAGLITKKLHDSGRSTAYYKAAMSGNPRREDGSLIPGDAAFVKEASGIPQPLEEMCPYVYELAYSPHLSSRIEGNPVDLQAVVKAFEAASRKYDYVTVEGSGGILCPIRWDLQEDGTAKNVILLEDVIHALDLSCLIVADAGLGTINNVVLTAEYMKRRSLPVKGIIFNNWHPGDVMEEDNLRMCEALTGLKVLTCVPPGAKELDMDADQLAALYE